MKKILFVSICLMASIAHSQYYTEGQYGTQYYGGYPSAQATGRYIVPQQQVYAQSVYQQPTDQFAYQQQVARPVYVQPPQPAYPQGYVPETSYAPSRTEEPRKRFYGSLRLGYGQTRGWGKPFKDPSSVILGGALGMRFHDNFRADVELSYHFKDGIYNKAGYKLDYSQYNIGINGYYDFPVDWPVRPFVGIGAGLTNSKVSTKGAGWTLKASDDETNLAIAAAAGLAYDINDSFTLEGMLRARYIFCDGDIYNLEGLLGARYNF